MDKRTVLPQFLLGALVSGGLCLVYGMWVGHRDAVVLQELERQALMHACKDDEVAFLHVKTGAVQCFGGSRRAKSTDPLNRMQ